MRPIHYLSILAALLIAVGLYYGGNTVKPKKAQVASSGGEHEGHEAGSLPKAATTDSLRLAGIKALPQHGLEEINAFENQIKDTKDSALMVPLFEKLSTAWASHKQPGLSAYYSAKAAHLAHSEKKLNFAGQIFLDLMRQPASPGVQVWAVQQAIGCFEESLLINPSNDSTKILLATSYIEGSENPMQGISLLREIVAKEPDNLAANLKLGEFSIQSGQYDKAVGRMETVLKQEPNNRSALYFLGVAYMETGQREKAIATFERCKKVVNNPDFSRDVEKYIQSFK